MVREADYNILASPWTLFLLTVIFITSCAENKPVDKQYLQSEDYTSFKNRTAKEIEENTELEKSFEWDFEQFGKCEVNHLSFPFELDLQRIESLVDNLSENCITARNGENLTLLGESGTSGQLIRWMLLERETAYRDHELIAIVYQNQELKSFKTVGIFQKNPSREISTDLEVTKEDNKTRVSSQTHRNILYPIEQNNSVLTEYEIDSTGGIKQL